VNPVPARPGSPASVEAIVTRTGIENPTTHRVPMWLVRGVPPDAYAFHGARFVEGRPPAPGAREAVIGRAVAARNPWLGVGQLVSVRGRNQFTIVGIFESDGSAFESEIWTDLSSLQAVLRRPTEISSIRLHLAAPEMLESVRATIDGNPALGLSVFRETEYYDKLGRGIAGTLRALAIVVGVFFYLAAAVGAMITMFAGVAGRTREIATLRAIGFRRTSILASFLLEAVVLTATGGAAGTLAALATRWIEVSTLNGQTYTQLVWRFEPTPWILLSSALLSVFVGMVGGLLPALRASRLPPAAALRQA
jgi:putative ABC transport system permease protein